MAYGFDEGKNKISFADYFTYVIDSQAKFDDWVNGVSGNDYSYVAIIGGKGAGTNGAYVQTKSNNLTGKTKGIQGFCGARIEASLGKYIGALSYNALVPGFSEVFIKDLTVSVVNGGYGFYNCTNLNNCTGFGLGRLLDPPVFGYGFYNCTNLNNCTGIGGTNSGNAFYNCKRLSFCTATGTTKKYVNCYVTSTANETYKIPENGSDTPNGGFNV